MLLGYALCGSFCTHSASLDALCRLLAAGHDVVPIVSERVASTDTRFGRAQDLLARLHSLTGRECISSVREAEPLGPVSPLDALIIAPCTGNTLAKMARGITDSAVTMAAKAHLRTDRPLLIALATNDAMSANLSSLAAMLTRKGVYFVPMRQDDPEKKPHSLVADFARIDDALVMMMQGRQIRPLFI